MAFSTALVAASVWKRNSIQIVFTTLIGPSPLRKQIVHIIVLQHIVTDDFSLINIESNGKQVPSPARMFLPTCSLV